jgi:hypothetical protein
VPSIGIWGGGELGGEGVRAGENGTELPGGKGNNREFEEKFIWLEGAELSFSIEPINLTGGGVVKPRVGKYSEVLGLNHGTTSRERGMLSLKSHAHMVIGIQHLQTVISSPMDQNYQKCISKRSKTIQASYKLRMHYDYIGSARTCAIKKCKKSAHAHDAWLWTLKATHLRTMHLWCWLASHPLLVQLPSRFNIQILVGSGWVAGQRPKGGLNNPFSH